MSFLSHLLPVVGVRSEWKSRADLGKTFGGPSHWKGDCAPPPIEIQNSNKQITIIWESIQILSTPMVTHINAFIETLNLLRKFCCDRVLSIDTTCQLNYSVRPEDFRGRRDTDMLLEDP